MLYIKHAVLPPHPRLSCCNSIAIEIMIIVRLFCKIVEFKMTSYLKMVMKVYAVDLELLLIQSYTCIRNNMCSTKNNVCAQYRSAVLIKDALLIEVL